eukprot:CAMPEP_0194031700 /NCGR_PEP_ID=MMETSP0009_2-20130614/4806_1 /TAXON_ID=210454 /ORGANISM="Grammatophora oceanica, Strain CCMP 410" /LENGTH=286 /DNA_ID=CAMNT_0038671923 /DNA_START=55 /DNA_END=915 /DNA_ORIENTATION=+
MKSFFCPPSVSAVLVFASIFCSALHRTKSFTASSRTRRTRTSWLASSPPATKELKGFETVVPPPPVEPERKEEEEEQDLSKLPMKTIKNMLVDLVPRMTGKKEEYRQVEAYVNALEEKYTTPQTLDFLNLAVRGDWQLLFSTTLRSGPRSNFRLRELVQKVRPSGLNGTITNVAVWDFAEDGTTFDASGTFSASCNYTISQGSRMVIDLEEHTIELAKGSKLPKDVPAVVGLLRRAMPSEIFDPSEHAMDTTYLDGDLKIARMTGSKYEGVRDIFIRQGSIEISPE